MEHQKHMASSLDDNDDDDDEDSEEDDKDLAALKSILNVSVEFSGGANSPAAVGAKETFTQK